MKGGNKGITQHKSGQKDGKEIETGEKRRNRQKKKSHPDGRNNDVKSVIIYHDLKKQIKSQCILQANQATSKRPGQWRSQ